MTNDSNDDPARISDAKIENEHGYGLKTVFKKLVDALNENKIEFGSTRNIVTGAINKYKKIKIYTNVSGEPFGKSRA